MLLDNHIPVSYLFNKVKWDVLRVLIISALFHVWKLLFSDVLPGIPIALPSLLGTGISLLLAFKLNQSYDRWWEARKVWGAIVNDSRSLVLQWLTFAGDAGARVMGHRQIGWCYSLGQALRGLDPLEGLDRFVSPQELDEVRRHANKPLALLALHARDLRELASAGRVNAYQQIQLDGTLVRLCDSMGKAERIRSTVFPATYRRFIHYFIYLFLIVLSLALVETVGLWEIPLLTLVASTFFLIEKTSFHMQDPFRNRPTDTAVTAIARTIDINIRQLLGDSEVPEPWPAGEFYLM